MGIFTYKNKLEDLFCLSFKLPCSFRRLFFPLIFTILLKQRIYVFFEFQRKFLIDDPIFRI